MHRLIALAALLALGGCATTGTAGLGVDLKRNGSDAAKRATPAEVVVSYDDGSPAPHARLRAMDTSERVYDVDCNDTGRASIAVWSPAMSLWRVLEADGTWSPIPPCRTYAADGKKAGLRFACTISRGGAK